MIIAIDGACRRNGKPDCLSAGGVFIKYDEGAGFTSLCAHENNSTNQRGELFALILGLDVGLSTMVEDETVYIITDSEYIANTINKEWYKNWARKGWTTASGDPVKNRDLWERITRLLERYPENTLVVYHIKGHVMTFGKATANKILDEDKSGEKLYETLSEQYTAIVETRYKNEEEHAKELFKKNNGFECPTNIFREMILCNTVADFVAGKHADKMDSE